VRVSELPDVVLQVGLMVAAAALVVLSMVVLSALKRRWSARQLAALVDRFGFVPVPPFETMEPVFAATVNGYRVEIAPRSRGRRIRVRLRHALDGELSTAETLPTPVRGRRRVRFRDPTWRRFFGKAQASPALAAWWSAEEGSGSPLDAFVRRWASTLGRAPTNAAHFDLHDDHLTCSPRRGGRTKPAGAEPYLRFDDAAALIPDLVALAAYLDARAPRALAGSGPSRTWPSCPPASFSGPVGCP
jgi:hypothetical protein